VLGGCFLIASGSGFLKSLRMRESLVSFFLKGKTFRIKELWFWFCQEDSKNSASGFLKESYSLAHQ
jgi:hypothetical protein